LALVQACLASFMLLVLLDVPVAAGALPMLAGAVLAAFLGTTFGLFVSAFASSEFQAVQFLPAFVFPQLLVCGLFVPREHMAKGLQWLSDVMPMTYSVDAMKQVAEHSAWTGMLWRDLAVVVAVALGVLVLGSVTIRRQD